MKPKHSLPRGFRKEQQDLFFTCPPFPVRMELATSEAARGLSLIFWPPRESAFGKLARLARIGYGDLLPSFSPRFAGNPYFIDWDPLIRSD